MYALVVVEKHKKGNDSRIAATYTSKEYAEKIVGEKKWKNSIPYIMPLEEADAFVESQKTGIYAPTYVEPTREEELAQMEKEQLQQKYEKERAMVYEPQQEGESAEEYKERVELGSKLLASKYGITTSPEATKEIQAQIEEAYVKEAEEKTEEEKLPYTTREEFMAEIYRKMGYSTDIGEKQFTAYKPTEQIVVGAMGTILTAKGTVTEPTSLKIYEEFIPKLQHDQTPIEMAKSYYAGKPFQMYGAWYTQQKTQPEEELGFSTREGILSPREEGQRSRLEDLGITIERRETARQDFLEKIGHEERLQNVAKLWKQYIPSERYIPSFIRGGFNIVSTLPFRIMEFGLYLPQIPERTAFLVGGTIIPSTRERFVEAHKKGVRAGFQAIGDVVRDPEMLGGVAALSLIPAYFKVRKGIGKKAEASRVLKDIGKEKPPDIVGTQYYQKPIIKYGIKADKIYKTQKVYIKQPSKIPVSRYEVEVLKPSLMVGKSVPLKAITKITPAKLVSVLVGKKQITFYPKMSFSRANLYGRYTLPTELAKKGTLPSIQISRLLSTKRPIPKLLSPYERTLYHETLHHVNRLLPEAAVRLKTPTTTKGYFFKTVKPIKTYPSYTYITTPKGMQYITAVIKKAGKTYYVRTTIKPTGLAKTTVFRGDVPLKTYKYVPSPIVKFLEPLRKTTHKQYVSMPEFRRQISTKITKSKTVQTTGIEGYKVKGLRVTGTKNFLQTYTIKPRVKVLGKPVYYTHTGESGAYILPKMIEIGKTKYVYVKYLPKQKPFIYTSGDFGVFLKRPAISKTIQITKIKQQFGIKFMEVKPTPLYQRLKVDILFKSKKGQLALEPFRLFKKQRVEEVVQILKPTVKHDIISPKVYFPNYSLLAGSYTPLLSFISVGLASGSKRKIDTKPKIQPKPKIEPLIDTKPIIDIKPRIQPKPKIEPIIDIKPIIKTKEEPLIEPIPQINLISKQAQDILQQQRVVQQQQILQQQISLLTPTAKMTIPRVPVPPSIPPILLPPLSKKPEEIPTPTTKEEGYHVYVKRKQIKKGKGYRSRGYEKANQQPLTREAALGLGASIVDTYTNRSFTIRKANKKAIARRDLELKWRLLKEKFRRSKSRPNVAVEKSKHAIDSIEEKKGIPYEAARLRRMGLLNLKKKKNNLMKINTLMNIKRSNSFLRQKKKKRKGVKKWL